MTQKDYSTIQRQIGTIEGVVVTLENTWAAPICDALAVIEEIIDKEIGVKNE